MEYLEKYNAMKYAIAECHKIDEIKNIRDAAEAMRYALIQAKESPEWIRQAEEIKLRAERKAGEILNEQGRKPGETDKAIMSQATTLSPKLNEIGITRDQSSNWRRIADVPEKEFEDYIQTQKEITTSGAVKIARELEQIEKRKDFKEQPLPENKYQIIYADPAWEYRNSGFAMSAEKQYPTMSTDKIMALDIESIADINSTLFLWTTNPLLEDAFRVIKAWGFEYKTNMVWIKNNHTAGFYIYGQHELLLIATKGQMTDINIKPKSIITGENKVHSKKPGIVYEIIEGMYPGLNYVELFARQTRDNWESWGYEI